MIVPCSEQVRVDQNASANVSGKQLKNQIEYRIFITSQNTLCDLQNRRAAGYPVAGGFDPHSLPPFVFNNLAVSGWCLRVRSRHENRVAVIKTSYNNRLQPVLISAATTSGTSILNLTYNFNLGNGTTGTDNGNVIQIANGKDSNRTQNFIYDALNRIQQAYTSGTNWGETYGPTATNPGVAPSTPGIDPWDNLTNRSGVTGKTAYEPLDCIANTANQLNSCYTYDAAGNLIRNGAETYTYDAENRLIATSGDSYIYDGDSQRIEKCTAGPTPGTCSSTATGTFYWKFPEGSTEAESDLGGNWTAAYGLIGGQIISRVDLPADVVHYYFHDHLNSTNIVTDVDGNILNESDYYPYGGEIVITDTDSNRYKFTGKERDAESGLDMFGARYYGSSLGRFITPDWAAKPTNVPYASFGNPQSLNLYSYVNNNPTTTRDSDGHEDGGTAAVAAVAGCAASGTCAAAAVGAVAGAGQASLVVLPVAAMVIAVEQPPMEQGDPMTPGYVPAPAIATGAPPSTTTNVATGTPASTSQQGAVDASAMQQAGPNYAGNNIVQGSGRVNSDLPGGQAEAGQKFGELTAGQGTSVDAKTGHTVADDGTRLRNNADGTARIDRPASVTGGQHETVHFNQPKKPDQPNQ